MRLFTLILLLLGITLAIITPVLSWVRHQEQPQQRLITTYSDEQGKQDLFIISIDGHVERITNNYHYEYFKGIHYESRQIVYVSLNNLTEWKIYVSSIHGKQRKFLTKIANDDFLSVSPDGRWIYFVEINNNTKMRDIYRININGQYKQKFASNFKYISFVDWSPDGQYMLFNATRDSYMMYTMKADGSEINPLLPATSMIELTGWSDDSKWAYLRIGDEIYADFVWINVTTGESREVFLGVRFQDIHVEKDLVVFHQTYRESGTILFISNLEGTNVRQITQKSEDWILDFRISPDAQWAYFAENANNNVIVSRIHLDSLEIETLVSFEDNFFKSNFSTQFLTWSPDGQWIIFEASEAGQAKIYRMRLDGSDVQPLTSLPVSEQFLGWSPDGQWMLVRVTDTSGSEHLYRMKSDGSDSKKLINNSAFSLYDWLPIANLNWQPQWLLIVAFLCLSFSFLLTRRLIKS